MSAADDDAVARQARLRPEAIAVISGRHRVTFAELDRTIDVAANGLADAGLRAGSRVTVELSHSIQALAMVFALDRIGAPYLSLDPGMPPEERDVLRHEIRAEMAVAMKAEGAAGDRRVVADAAWWSRADALPARERPVLSDDAPALFVRSSGTTTAAPKIALWSRAYLRRSGASPLRRNDPQDVRYLAVVSFGFGVGLRSAIRTLGGGGAVVIPRGLRRPEDIVALVRRHRVNVGFLIPAMMRDLAAVPRAEPLLPQLDPLGVGTGATSSAERRVFRERISPGLAISMGTNEIGGIFSLKPRDPKIDLPGAVGYPIGDIQVELLGPKGRPVPPGGIGQLRVRAPGMPTGYCNDAAREAGGFRLGWFYTGDLMSADEDGCYFHRGRIDDEIDIGGRKVQPEEIETVLRQHPAVMDVSVVGRATSRGKRPVAFVVLRETVDETMLRHFCSAHLAAHKVPIRVVAIDALPRNAAGKVLRRRLRDQPL